MHWVIAAFIVTAITAYPIGCLFNNCANPLKFGLGSKIAMAVTYIIIFLAASQVKEK